MKINGFASDAEVRALVRAFECGSLGLAEFSHSAHIAVAMAYLADESPAAATARMRSGLHRFLAHHGKNGGYHETLTLFWMRLLDHLSRNCNGELPLWERVNDVVRSHGGKWPVEAHYSRACVETADARQHWIAPDLLPLPF